MKFRTTKISSEGLGGNFAKFCTSKKFPTVWYVDLEMMQQRAGGVAAD